MVVKQWQTQAQVHTRASMNRANVYMQYPPGEFPIFGKSRTDDYTEILYHTPTFCV